MNKITSMRIVAVNIQHCRSYTASQSIKFYDKTLITGANGVGKTTIAHAITYALYGVNYYGVQDISFLRSDGSGDITVQIGFMDQDQVLHRLSRTRNGDTTSLSFDSYTIRQADIDAQFCDKATFLCLFNPLYLASLPDKPARELVLKSLPPVLPDQVLGEMSEAFRVHLDGQTLTNPDEQLKACRAELKRVEANQQRLKGQLEEARNQKEHAGEYLVQQKQELMELQEKARALKARKYEGVNRNALEMQKMELEQKLADYDRMVTRLETKLEDAKRRTYQSQYITALAEVTAQLTAARQEFKDVKNRYEEIKPGFVCPTCTRIVGDAQLPAVKESFDELLEGIQTVGADLVAKKKEIETLQKKEQEIFEQYKADDIKKLQDELTELQKQTVSTPDHPSLSDQLAAVEEQLQYGNLGEQACIDLSVYMADITSLERSIKDLETQDYKERLLELINQRTALEDEYTSLRNQQSALQEYLTVRANLAVRPLEMPHTTVRLYDMNLSGVLQNVFFFEYKGRKFDYLSSSEKIRAGMEIAAMMRHVTGMDVPLFVDEAQSLHEFSGTGSSELSILDGDGLRSQVIICCCSAGKPLSVLPLTSSRKNLAEAS